MKTSVKLDANTYENMSPEAVKASVQEHADAEIRRAKT